MSRGTRHARRFTRQERRDVKAALLRYGAHCHWCMQAGIIKPLTARSATIDHVVPLSMGGTNAPENLVLSCYDCNHARGSDMPERTNRSWRLDKEKGTRGNEVDRTNA